MTWMIEYKRALVRYALANGDAVSTGSHYWAWQTHADDQREALIAALDVERIDVTAVTVEESTWFEHGDTDHGGDRAHGVDLRFELDGERVHWRYGGTVSSLTVGMLNEQ